MWRLEGCHDVSFNCTARELSNCFRTSRTSSLVRISTCRHSHVCIILRWKVGFFVLWHAFFKCSLGERINKKMNEKFVAILLRYREQPRPCIYLSISFYIYIYVHIFIRGRKPSLNAATDVNRKVLRWASWRKSSKETRWVHHSCWDCRWVSENYIFIILIGKIIINWKFWFVPPKESEKTHSFQCQENPPISKSTPPTAGAILWARSIFHRAKRPILSFKTMPHLSCRLGFFFWKVWFAQRKVRESQGKSRPFSDPIWLRCQAPASRRTTSVQGRLSVWRSNLDIFGHFAQTNMISSPHCWDPTWPNLNISGVRGSWQRDFRICAWAATRTP